MQNPRMTPSHANSETGLFKCSVLNYVVIVNAYLYSIEKIFRLYLR